MSIFRSIKVITSPEEFGYSTSVDPRVPFSEVQRYFLGLQIHSRLGYDSERGGEIEIETPYLVTEIIDLGLVKS